MKELVIPFSDVEDMLECAILFANAQEKGNVSVVTPIYYPLYIVETKYGNLIVDPDLNFSMNVKYVNITATEFSEMIKKLENITSENEFIEIAGANNLKIREIVEKNNYAYKKIPGILPTLILDPINAELDGITIPVDCDFDSVKNMVSKELLEIEQKLEFARSESINYFNELIRNADSWKKQLRKKLQR
jgi:tetrahydromethanopterin S-methyltransferase subunit G